MTTLVDRLVDAGCATRTHDPKDRRHVSIALEPSTWRAFATIYRPLAERVQAATAELAGHHREVVISALGAMQRAFDDSRSTPD